MRRLVAVLLVLVAMGTVVLAAGTQAVSGDPPDDSAPRVERLVSFDPGPDALELPEGVAVDKRGTVYVSLAPRGELVAIDPRGAQRLVATLPVGRGFGAIGLAVDAPGNVYVGVSTFDPATNGVYRVARDGTSRRLPGTAGIELPNALAFDKRGNLYVTDSFLGAIWRIPPGGAAELWLQHGLLEGDGSAPPEPPIGANGIVHRQRTLYVANTELGSVVAVPIAADGSPDDPYELVPGCDTLKPADGLAIDVHGDLYVAVVGQDAVVRVPRDVVPPTGEPLPDWCRPFVTTLATGSDGLDFPSSLAFGTGKGERRRLYIVNFSAGPLFGWPRTHGPALLALANDTPGQPMP